MRLIICLFNHAQNCHTIGLAAQSHKEDELAPVTAGAGTASIAATPSILSPAVPLAATAAPGRRASCGKQASSATRRNLVARRSGKPYSPPPLAQRRLTPSMSPLSTPSETLREVCLVMIDFNLGCEHQTPNTHVSNTLPKNAWHTIR